MSLGIAASSAHALTFDLSFTNTNGVGGGPLDAFAAGQTIDYNTGRLTDGAIDDVSFMSLGDFFSTVGNLANNEYTQTFGIAPTFTPASSAAPREPATWTMILMGFAGLGYFASRRGRSALHA
jgi:hypothetical protein